MNTWIIGGTTGIGAAVAVHLQRLGERPLVTGEAIDVTRFHPFVEYVFANRPFDEVVYCAGVNFPEMIGDIMHAERTFAVNVIGFISLLNELRSYQLTHPTSIVAVSSDAARVPMRGSIAYCASKAALSHAVRCAARELAPDWRVNAVAPGIVDGTPMTKKLDEAIPAMRGWTSAQARGYEESMIPMGRRASVEEVAQVIVDVLRGPGFMTGSIVEITGGK